MNTNDMSDEALVTAYALGELDGAESASERARVEALIASDAGVRDEIKRIREVGDELQRELQLEAAGGPAPALTLEQRRAIESELKGPPVHRLRPWLLAAASLAAIAVLVWELRPIEHTITMATGPAGAVAIGETQNAPRGLGYVGTSKEKDEVASRMRSLGYLGGSKQDAAATLATSQSENTHPEKSPFAYEAYGGDLVPKALKQLGYVDVGNSRASLQEMGYASAGGPAVPGSDAPHGIVADGKATRSELCYWRVQPTPNTESYAPIVEQGFASPIREPLSTFSIDVDTASYANVRRFLNQGQLPPPDAVRIEELVNYFAYDYPAPDGSGGETPFATHVAVADCPWARQHRLVRIGIKGREVPAAERAPSNLVFLLDVSGSMNEPDKLPLLVASLRLLTGQLDERDHVAVVTYAGNAGLRLESTKCDGPGRQKVIDTLDNLSAGGSTAGAAGIQLAYQIATGEGTFVKGGTNRVILATDGDFNVGVTDKESLQRLIETSAKSGVFLSVLGFGTGNLKDGTAELLADKGNGNYSYIDSLGEGQRVLVHEMGGTLITIAKDVKIQVEFNPAKVGAYRLIGYEDRALAAADFNNDKKDAGEIGAGHTITALYEVVPVGVESMPGVDLLKYQAPASAAGGAAAPNAAPQFTDSPDLLTVKLRWKQPDSDTSTKLEWAVQDGGGTLAQAGPDASFSAAVAAFGMLLRASGNAGDASWDSVIALAEAGRGADKDGYRAEFIRLAKVAKGLSAR